VRSRIDFLSSVLAARQIETPLAIGLFGDWGSGKTFFMRRLQERVGLLTESSATAEDAGEPTLYCSNVRQVTFNAWLYSDSDIWPTFAAQVFRSITGATEDVPSGAAQAGHLAEYQKELQGLEEVRSAAERDEAALDERLIELDAKIETKQAEIQALARNLGPEAGAAGKLIADLNEILERALRLVRNWRSIRVSELVILAVPVGVAVSAVFFEWARILALLAAVTGVVVLVLASLRYVERTRALREEIDGLERQRLELQEEREARAEERKTAERTLASASVLPLLPECAEEQAARWLGRQQLGVVTEIRLAFERLSKMIDAGNAARQNRDQQARPQSVKELPIERVIIYIDDLDRCPPEVVVRVLETIKVLLDLPHFVVVVGVDSRWLFRSIEVHFSELLGREDGSDEDGVWAATPQNYLEKIFQYSIVLRPIGTTGFERLIESLLRVEEEVAGRTSNEPRAETQSDRPEQLGMDVGPTTRPTGDQPRQGEPPQVPLGAPQPELDLSPADLVITRDELLFVKRLAPLFTTPRAAKRLVNVYRLLRVSAGAGTLERDNAYEYALVLLALTIAFPALAGDVFRAVHRSPGENWAALLKGLAPRTTELPRGVGAETTNDVSGRLSPSEAAAWGKLVDALDAIWSADSGGPPLSKLAEWTEIVAEFSFHPWQDLLPASTRG
jgi:hypothetical protein